MKFIRKLNYQKINQTLTCSSAWWASISPVRFVHWFPTTPRFNIRISINPKEIIEIRASWNFFFGISKLRNSSGKLLKIIVNKNKLILSYYFIVYMNLEIFRISTLGTDRSDKYFLFIFWFLLVEFYFLIFKGFKINPQNLLAKNFFGSGV